VPNIRKQVPLPKGPKGPGRRAGTPLTRERIVARALALLDQEGPGALSMRKLGADLGVDPMAVYYHLPNKEALLDAVVEAVMAAIDLASDDPSATPEDRIMHAAHAYRKAMLGHANALPIVLARGPVTPVAMRPVELLLGILREAGLPPARALAGMNAIAAAVRGVVGMETAGKDGTHAPAKVEALAQALPQEDFPHLREAMLCGGDSLEQSFEFGIRCLAKGLLASVPPKVAAPESENGSER